MGLEGRKKKRMYEYGMYNSTDEKKKRKIPRITILAGFSCR